MTARESKKIPGALARGEYRVAWQVGVWVHSRVLGQRWHDVPRRRNLGLIPRHTYKPQLSASRNVTSNPAAHHATLLPSCGSAACPHYPLSVFSGCGCWNEQFWNELAWIDARGRQLVAKPITVISYICFGSDRTQEIDSFRKYKYYFQCWFFLILMADAKHSNTIGKKKIGFGAFWIRNFDYIN